MTIKEAHKTISDQLSSNHTIFITIRCGWYNHVSPEKNPIVEYRVSVLPGFGKTCTQEESGVSLKSAVEQILMAIQESKSPKAKIDQAETALTEMQNINL